MRRCEVADMRGRRIARAIAKVEIVALIAAIAAIAWLLVPGWMSQRRESRRVECLANLERIGQGLERYIQHSGGRWPHVAKLPSAEYHAPPWPGLPAVLGPYVGGDSSLFRCPADSRLLAEISPLRKKFAARTTYFETEGTSYEWVLQELYAGQPVGKDVLSRAGSLGLGPADQPVIWEFEPFHAAADNRDALNILYADFKARAGRRR